MCQTTIGCATKPWGVDMVRLAKFNKTSALFYIYKILKCAMSRYLTVGGCLV
jgi:hypothetical protein